MSTISQITGNVIAGVFTTTVALVLFGSAVRFGSNSNLTPRAWSRPRAVLTNVLNGPFYGVSWIFWATKQSYSDLLAGIPGTGTRKDGWSGPTLKANLDAVIQIRFHTLQFKVSVVATLLMMFFLMPLYYTTRCDPLTMGLQTCINQLNLTDFEQLTIANVPDYSFNPRLNGTTVIQVDGNTTVILQARDNPLTGRTWIPGLTGRYVAVVCVMFIISLFSCYLLWYEWIECLALRRVYYLESEYFLERIEELDNLQRNKDPEDPFQERRPPFLPHPEMRETIPNVSLNSVLYQLPNSLKEYKAKGGDDEGRSLLERQLDATVGFFDRSIPNQPGFSSSVVAVTIVPDAKLVKGAWMKWYACGKKFRRLRFIKHLLEKRKRMQDDGVRGIHDYVDTALKAPKQVAIATGNAAKATGKAMVQATGAVCGRSHFSQTQKQQDSSANIEGDIENETNSSNEKNEEEVITQSFLSTTNNDEDEFQETKDARNGSNWLGQVAAALGIAQNDADDIGRNADMVHDSIYQDAQARDSLQVDTTTVETTSGVFFDAKSSKIESERPQSPETDGSGGHFEYQNFDPEEFAKWIGYTEETTCDEILDTLGVEQLTAYSREMSQSASNLCVNGCNEEALAFKSIEELEDLLEDAWDDVREANAELLRVRGDIFRKENRLPILRKNVESADDISLDKVEESDESGSPAHPIDIEVGAPAQTASERSGLRQRMVPSAESKYKMAQSLVNRMNNTSFTTSETKKEKDGCCQKSNLVCFAELTDSKVTKVLDHPTFAVVTFTSRQSAVAARQCLADGKGIDRWVQVDAIPVPPLADAPPCDLLFCRACCRPVTLTINPKERKFRQAFVWTFYFFFCCLYAIPLALTSAVLNPDYLAAAFPDSPIWRNSNGVFYRVFAGISSGMLYSLFFSVLPQVFKYLAFMLGSASTVAKGEDNAFLFYWYFMLVTAFTGSTLATMLLQGFVSGNFGMEFRDALNTVARTIPTSQAPVWLNWMITRTFITLPMNYLFQSMTFFYGCLRLKCLNRVMRGGGPGGPPPYRINIDSGVVFMCITSLGPAAPIIAPFATLYYMIFIPMLRWLHIFVYRPKYDAGGARFPIYHDQVISSLILAQVLTAALLLLKQAIVPGFIVFGMGFPTFFFSQWTKEKFLRSYMDAGLLQSSQLDGWGGGKTIEWREKYRRWLVDCHKASFVPLCLSGGEEFLTCQPAVAVPTYRDMAEEADEEEESEDGGDTFEIMSGTLSPSPRRSLQQWKQESTRIMQTTAQKGAVFNRYLDS